MNSNDKLAEAVRALADTWRESDSPVSQAHAALLDGALAATALHPPVEGEWVMVPRYRWQVEGSDEWHEGRDWPNGARNLTVIEHGPTPPADKQDGGGISATVATGLIEVWRHHAGLLKTGRKTLLRCANELEAALAANYATPAPSDADGAVGEWIKSPHGDFPELKWRGGHLAVIGQKLYTRPQTEPAPQGDARDAAGGG